MARLADGRRRGDRPLPGGLVGRDRRSRPLRPGRRNDPVPGQLPRRLARRAGCRPRRRRRWGCRHCLINDARAFGLAELRLGAGRGASLDDRAHARDGVGGVIAVDGHVHQGHDGTAGEIGHQTIDPDGPWCGCGNRGCLEAFARADQIAAACGTADRRGSCRAGTGRRRPGTEGSPQVGRYLGIGIANMVTVVSPDRIVIGGGICRRRRSVAGPDPRTSCGGASGQPPSTRSRS